MIPIQNVICYQSKNRELCFSHLFATDGVCSKNDFLCANDICASASVVCDGKDDCGDNSDEGTVCSGLI